VVGVNLPYYAVLTGISDVGPEIREAGRIESTWLEPRRGTGQSFFSFQGGKCLNFHNHSG